MSSEEAGDFMAELLGEMMICFDTVDPGDEVFGLWHDMTVVDGERMSGEDEVDVGKRPIPREYLYKHGVRD